MSPTTQERYRWFAALPAATGRDMLRGIEREALRVDAEGRISQLDHPAALGHPLTHPLITTDYSEALLELITPVCSTIEALFESLQSIHQFTMQRLPAGELLWPCSMPCILAGNESVRIAEYGTSHLGQLKHIYRKGLDVRYGRVMQSIAGVHYNWSLGDRFWTAMHEQFGEGQSLAAFRNQAYFGLIRNYRRWSWLLVLLFGASPAVDRSFVDKPVQGLEPAGKRSLLAEAATALRMGDLGYHNDEQSSLFVCFNGLKSYIDTLYRATHTPAPRFEEIGTFRNGERVQLNTNVLQIANEYYNNVRPKRVAEPGETPLQALSARGVEYIEVRCLDVSPFDPCGISPEQVAFLDVFLLTCLLEASPRLDRSACTASQENFARAVNLGRCRPLHLIDTDPVRSQWSAEEWAGMLFERFEETASLLDRESDRPIFTNAVLAARNSLTGLSGMPSVRLAETLSGSTDFVPWSLEQARRHQDEIAKAPRDREAQFEALTADSVRAEAALRARDEGDFEPWLENWLAAGNIR